MRGRQHRANRTFEDVSIPWDGALGRFNGCETSHRVLERPGVQVANERLRTALAKQAATPEQLAEELQVDPKTVQRWLAGRTPHGRHRRRLAAHLRADEGYLWPDAERDRELSSSRAELVAIYPHRSDVPREVWRDLFDGAVERIDLLAYAAAFLPELLPDLVDTLKHKAEAGCRIRIDLGDPTSEAVSQRRVEERFGEGIESRARIAFQHYAPLAHLSEVSIQQHGTTLYNSMYRFDDQLLVSPHLWGANAYLAPVLHLKQVEGGTLFGMYADNFDAVWAVSNPVIEIAS